MPFIHHNGRRILFVHIPRTGGTTIERWMAGIAPLQFRSVGVPPVSAVTPQHYTYGDLRWFFAAGYFDYAFTVVRDARIESEFRLRARLGQQSFWGSHPEFTQWLDATLLQARSQPGLLDNHVRPQVEFLGGEVRVFRYESGLERVVETVARDCGLPAGAPLERWLSTQGQTPAVCWETQDISRVNAFYAADFEAFSYLKRAVVPPDGCDT